MCQTKIRFIINLKMHFWRERVSKIIFYTLKKKSSFAYNSSGRVEGIAVSVSLGFYTVGRGVYPIGRICAPTSRTVQILGTASSPGTV